MLSSSAAVGAYQTIATNSEVDAASPHRLIQLMMSHAIEKIGLAKSQIRNNHVAAKGKSISEAISVIGGLQASLNHKADERMSSNFDALYAYMMRQLLYANIENDETKLEEVSGLLGELKEAWDAISPQAD